MNKPKLIAEIDRLFEQLVRDPWTRAPRTTRTHGGEIELVLALPVVPSQREGVSVAIEGRRLVVRAHHRAAHAGDPMTLSERVITLPEDAEVSSLEAHFEGTTLHVRVRLHPTHREQR